MDYIGQDLTERIIFSGGRILNPPPALHLFMLLDKEYSSTMRFLIFLVCTLFAGDTLAKQCLNITIPIHITARTGNYTIDKPTKPLEVTAFIQDYLRSGTNLSETLLSKVEPYVVSNGLKAISLSDGL